MINWRHHKIYSVHKIRIALSPREEKGGNAMVNAIQGVNLKAKYPLPPRECVKICKNICLMFETNCACCQTTVKIPHFDSLWNSI